MPASTRSNEKTAIGWFDAYCAEIQYKGWENRGNSTRAIWLNTIVMMMFLEWLIPRMNRGRGGLPSSGMGYAYLIMGKMARDYGFIFHYSKKRLAAHVKGMEWQWCQRHGPRTVERKKPFTPFQLDTWRRIIMRPSLASPRNMVALVMMSVAFCGMFRRSEYTVKANGAFRPKVMLTRSDVKWYDGKGRRLYPSPSLFAHPPEGMYCELAPPLCKNDQDGSKYHGDPLVFEYTLGLGGIGYASLLSAANYLFDLERQFPVLDEGLRKQVPLFVDPDTGRAFQTAAFDAIIKGVMTIAYCENPSEFPDPKEQSLHSFRAGGALALKAAGAAPDIIKAMGRWRSDTWEIYIRDRRPEAIYWGNRLRKVAQLDVERVPLAERYRPLNSWWDDESIEQVIANKKDSEQMRQTIEAAMLGDADLPELSAATSRELQSESEELVATLMTLDLTPEGTEEDHNRAMARVAQSAGQQQAEGTRAVRRRTE